MTERLYREEEVRRIFKLAASAHVMRLGATPGAAGLTLAEMQSVGREAGIEPDDVARAAAALEAAPAQHILEFLGAPIEIRLTMPLDRAFTDEQWSILVAELRSTFSARGSTTTYGNLREWRNGNLYAAVEPTAAGYRLRMGTFNANAKLVFALAGAGICGSALTWITHLVVNDPTSLVAPVGSAIVGLSAWLANRLRLPGWARKRHSQMQYIAAKVKSVIELP